MDVKKPLAADSLEAGEWGFLTVATGESGRPSSHEYMGSKGLGTIPASLHLLPLQAATPAPDCPQTQCSHSELRTLWLSILSRMAFFFFFLNLHSIVAHSQCTYNTPENPTCGSLEAGCVMLCVSLSATPPPFTLKLDFKQSHENVGALGWGRGFCSHQGPWEPAGPFVLLPGGDTWRRPSPANHYWHLRFAFSRS